MSFLLKNKFFDVSEWIDQFNLRLDKKFVIEAIVGVVIWVIRRFPNEMVFRDKPTLYIVLFDSIVDYFLCGMLIESIK